MNMALFDRLPNVEADLLVVFVPSEGDLPGSTAWVDENAAGQISQLRETGVFKASLAQTLLLPALTQDFAQAVLLVGVGKGEALSDMQSRKVVAAIAAQIKGLPFAKVAVASEALNMKARSESEVIACWRNG